MREWFKTFRRTSWVREEGIKVKRLTTLNQLSSALKADDTFLIVNPYGERFPAHSAWEWKQALAAVRTFISNGGIWVETGGYPFYYAMTPVLFHRYTAHHPPDFSDFMHLDSETGELSLFRCRPKRRYSSL